jgi:asparagine synthase (glutamine-hydrolysing)
MGEKPLFYCWMGRFFLFGSELKAIRRHPSFIDEIDRGAVALLLRHNYIPAPYSIYKNIYKLPPGTILVLNNRKSSKLDGPQPYWSMKQAVEAGRIYPFPGNEEEAISHLESLLKEVIRGQMIADVPLGAFLSGGIDSSLIVALMQVEKHRAVQTFTIGFHDGRFNEAEQAKTVATYLGTDHTELYITPQQAMSIIQHLPTLYDEPFSDCSQIPTFLLSQLARNHVTVSLSGDGGDELFAGYGRYVWGHHLWRNISWIPSLARNLVGSCCTVVPPLVWDRILRATDLLLPYGLKISHPGDKIHKLAEIIRVESPELTYLTIMSHWKNPTEVVLDATEPPTMLRDYSQWDQFPDYIHRMMYLDALCYLPDDILVKVDRASMGASLESRAPFLDHRLVEFAWSLPLSMKIRNGQGKWVLRQLLARYLPRSLFERPKSYFDIPLASWLRGPLREWAEDLLNTKRLKKEGFLNPSPIQQKWQEHQSGKRHWHYYLWNILMFQLWLEQEHN